MIGNVVLAGSHPPSRWQMPIVPESYDRSPLTEEEWWALEQRGTVHGPEHGHRKESIEARKALIRLSQPLTDVFRLRHQDRSAVRIASVHLVMHREMYRHGKMFWEWSPQEWMDTLRSTPKQFDTLYGRMTCSRVSIMDAAYLLGGVSDLRSAGTSFYIVEAANTYFGTELVAQQWKRMLEVVSERGYGESRSSIGRVQDHLCMLLVLNRSPYLEEISEELLAVVGEESRARQWSRRKITNGLRDLGILPSHQEEKLVPPTKFDSQGMTPEWYAWCMAWYERAVDFTPIVRQGYAHRILAVGRWLQHQAPDVRSPEQWTEDLALRFRADLCSWTVGQYSSARGRHSLSIQAKLGQPMKAHGIAHYLVSMRRYLSDLTRKPHAVNGEPARRITLDFVPKEAFTTPEHIRKALDAASPRDIDLQVWAKLTIAAATLSASDLPRNTRYPLSFYRAFGLVWVTSARRPNEIARLRLDCLREDWAPDMLDEDDQPVEKMTLVHPQPQSSSEDQGNKALKLYYLHIPAGKNRGPFWIWIPDYVADAINAWKRERPQSQRKLYDQKDREYVDYLFCYQDLRVGAAFINEGLIPTLCARAGIATQDAQGRITGHRGRSTRLTLLRSRGVSLDDLAEYAGHVNHRTIRRYARQNPLQLHRIIRDADDVSRIIEGVIDVQAAAQGLPALRWFIGYDADGEPQYCANQIYHTCPHRLDCPKCGMFIGAEKAKLLHEGTNALPITSKVPMTPIEKCLVEGDQEGVEACQAALQQVPAPETADIRLIFNPEGLSNGELQKLARLGTVDALGKLRQALDAHEKRLEKAKQHKTGHNALVGAQKKRIRFIQELLAACEQRQHEQESS